MIVLHHISVTIIYPMPSLLSYDFSTVMVKAARSDMVFSQWFSMKYHEDVDMNVPPHSEACFYLELRLMW